jgi:dedicator of cytokinesis protein 3
MRFFRTNFQDEIQRLPADSTSVLDEDVSARGQGGLSRGYDTGVVGVGDWSEQHVRANSISNGSTTQQPSTTLVGQASFMIPPLAFGQVPSSGVAAPPPTPGSSHFLPDGGRYQTPLQRNLARLTRYGMSSITSGPGDRTGLPDRTLTSEIDATSQQGSMINVGAGMVPTSSRVSTARDVASTFSAAKSRISRMGSFSWRNRG